MSNIAHDYRESISGRIRYPNSYHRYHGRHRGIGNVDAHDFPAGESWAGGKCLVVPGNRSRQVESGQR